jgi:hypothetical protein
MVMGSVLRWRASRRSGAEVKRPKDAMAQEQERYQTESGEPNPIRLEGI